MGQLPRRGRITGNTADRIVELLRRNAMTVDELADALVMSRTAVRAQVAALEHQRVVEQRAPRRGVSKPARTYGISAEAEVLFSHAYVPILTELLHVLSRRMSHGEFATIMREVGRGTMAMRPMPRGSLRDRVTAASALLNELGGLTYIEEHDSDRFRIHSHTCPLAAATTMYPEACDALESLVSEFVGAQVTKCCNQYDRSRCCFEVAAV